MKSTRMLLLVAAVAAVGALPAAHAADITTCPPGTSNPAYCQTENLPTATVSFAPGGVKTITTKHGAITVDTGTNVGCQQNLDANCGGSGQVLGNLGNASRLTVLGRHGFHVKSGKKLRVKIPLNSKRAKHALKKIKKLRVTIKIRTHSGPGGAIKTTTRHATIRLPRHHRAH